MDKLKRMLAAMLLGVLPVGAAAQEHVTPAGDVPSDEAKTATFAVSPSSGEKPDAGKRQALIESLRALQREPDKIPFHCAMCYDMSMPPSSVSYTCEACNTVTELPYKGPGELSGGLAYLKRSLADLPVKVTLDASPLCSKCGGGKPYGISLTTECGECGKAFTWSVSTSEEEERLRLLFLEHPIKSFDSGPRGVGGEGPDPKKTIENAEYIASRLFCEDCRNKLGLTGTK
ncbi:MAG TPA: hypothetical protein PKM25_05300 [Candidatus Ozemobacteraceae bacterium]|nr:hypothetical protein [Candidatus Ozemobacteraceae bacterium]